jgi:flagellum-specific peptidoglycan hydrolase FlgJ
MSLTAEQEAFLTKGALAAVTAEKATGCPAELSLAQAILESSWGFCAPENNYFGIKATGEDPNTYCLTKEYLNGQWTIQRDAFAVYSSMADSFIEHARLITEGKPYADAWQQYEQDRDLDSLIGNIARRYATDPNYTALVLQLAHGPHVTVAIQTVRAAA